MRIAPALRPVADGCEDGPRRRVRLRRPHVGENRLSHPRPEIGQRWDHAAGNTDILTICDDVVVLVYDLPRHGIARRVQQLGMHRVGAVKDEPAGTQTLFTEPGRSRDVEHGIRLLEQLDRPVTHRPEPFLVRIAALICPAFAKTESFHDRQGAHDNEAALQWP